MPDEGGQLPWVSKSRVNRAGEAFRAGRSTGDDEKVLEAWREAHAYVLNTFQALLRKKTKDTGVTVAQRLKRKSTILDKLRREPVMQLARMDDVVGCRLIFSSIRSLKEFRAGFHKARIRHKRRNDLGKYDYILRPKSSGYRGIHDIYEYNVKSNKGKAYNGLLIELQYRTRQQHAWATAVEFVEHLTKNQPKFNRGDERYIEFFRLASEIIARHTERMGSVYRSLSDGEVAQRLEGIDAQIHIIEKLRSAVPSKEKAAAKTENMILRFSSGGNLETYNFSSLEEATNRLFDLESEYPDDDIVLVRADTFKAIRSAYRNYFSDVSDFLKYASEGLARLKQVGRRPLQLKLDI